MLKLNQVKKVYSIHGREVTAIDQLSLVVETGQAVAIEGASGCGKTTLLLVSGALLHPTSGSVMIDDDDPYQMSANQRSAFRAKHIGFVFQQFHLIPYLDVLQNVLTASLPNKQPGTKERADMLIDQFQLQPRIHHLPAELSVGEKQRVALARALLNRPKLVLADEPTGNLDPANATIVLDALCTYADQGAAVLIVTHDPTAAERAHRRVRLDNGQIVDAG